MDLAPDPMEGDARVRARDIVQAAVAAATVTDAEAVQSMIAAAIGATYPRPLGDKPNNGGLIKAAGRPLRLSGGGT
jgi:hypothetical protein